MHELTPDSAETTRLLSQLRAGQPEALDQLLARHRTDLRRFIAQHLDPRLQARVDPSDVVQETELELFRRIEDFLRREPMPFRLWLRKTAYERLLMLRRQHLYAERRSIHCEVPLPDRSALLLAQHFLASGSTPSQQAARRELACRVRQAMARLPDGDREVLLMRDFEALTYAEIAALLEIDEAAARKRHGRSLVRLHKLLTEGGLTESQL